MPEYNQRSGRKRRRLTYSTSRSNRAMEGLYSIDRLLLRRLYTKIYETIRNMYRVLQFLIFSYVMWSFELLDNNIIETMMNASMLFAAFTRLVLEHLLVEVSDHCDIDPGDELERGHAHKPRIYKRLEDFTDQELRDSTNFDRWDIESLIRFFDLPEICFPD